MAKVSQGGRGTERVEPWVHLAVAVVLGIVLAIGIARASVPWPLGIAVLFVVVALLPGAGEKVVKLATDLSPFSARLLPRADSDDAENGRSQK